MSDAYIAFLCGQMLLRLSRGNQSLYRRVTRPGVMAFHAKLRAVLRARHLHLQRAAHHGDAAIQLAWLSFLSDLGGFANVLTIALMLMFPLANMASSRGPAHSSSSTCSTNGEPTLERWPWLKHTATPTLHI